MLSGTPQQPVLAALDAFLASGCACLEAGILHVHSGTAAELCTYHLRNIVAWAKRGQALCHQFVLAAGRSSGVPEHTRHAGGAAVCRLQCPFLGAGVFDVHRLSVLCDCARILAAVPDICVALLEQMSGTFAGKASTTI